MIIYSGVTCTRMWSREVRSWRCSTSFLTPRSICSHFTTVSMQTSSRYSSYNNLEVVLWLMSITAGAGQGWAATEGWQIHVSPLQILRQRSQDQGLRPAAGVLQEPHPGLHGGGIRSDGGVHRQRAVQVHCWGTTSRQDWQGELHHWIPKHN